MNEVKRYNVIADKYGDGTVELSDAGSVVFYEDYASLKIERDALAAENANLKHLLSMIAETGNANFGRTTLYTAATDAYLNSVRAGAVQELADAWYAIANETSEGVNISDSTRLKYRQRADDAADFSAQLRAGEPS